MSKWMQEEQQRKVVRALFADVVKELRSQGHSASFRLSQLTVNMQLISFRATEQSNSVGFHKSPTGLTKVIFHGLYGNNWRHGVVHKGRTFKQRKDGSWPVSKIAEYVFARASRLAHTKSEREAKDAAESRWQAAVDRLNEEFPEHPLSGLLRATTTGIDIPVSLTEEQVRALMKAPTTEEEDNDG